MTVLRRNMFRYRRSRTVQGCALGIGFMLIFAWKLYWPPLSRTDVMVSLQNQEHSLFDTLNKDDILGLSDQLFFWRSKVPTRHLMALPNCTPPAVNQFPNDLFTQEERQNGAIVIHVLVAIYMFLGLSVVCDDYFVPSLEFISEALHLQTDVAGATFMAAGSSAPELATSLIGVFVAKNDIGLGTVVGSAVYNILFVIGVCALFAGTVVHLNWWPLFRDCTCYTLSVIALLIVIIDEIVTWYEALVLVFLYFLYILIMYFNPVFEKWALNFCTCFPSSSPTLTSKLSDEVKVYDKLSSKGITEEDASKTSNEDTESSPILYVVFMIIFIFVAVCIIILLLFSILDCGHFEKYPDTDSDSDEFSEKRNFVASGKGLSETPSSNTCWTTNMSPTEVTHPEASHPKWMLSWPSWKQVKWIILLPIVFILYITIPDCRKSRFQRCYLLTFLMSVIWLSVFSFLMVWMITVTGYTLGIPDTVMGLTFVAFGVSVPDAIASLIVAREGYGDMAISNAVGSNIFDILLCMGFPWLLSTLFYQRDVLVYSEGLTYSVVTLLTTVLFLILATHINGWKLSIRYGISLMIVYVFFTALSVSYELNFFGYMHPQMCDVVY